jgi:spermidine synthase
LLLGAWLPLLAGKLGHSDSNGALLYGANSVGAALGALASGFALTPTIGSYGTIAVAALLMFVLGSTWAHSKKTWYALPLLFAAIVPVMSMPSVARLLPGQYAGSNDLYYYEDAVNITHVVEKADGQRVLLADLQRMDASSSPTAVQVQKNQARLPLLLHPAPETVLFLGLGTGISAAGSLPFPGLERTAVELSQGAINAADKWFEPVNDAALRHVNVVRDDARHYLMATDRTYDVIIGDLFHPDLVGRSALLSVQQFERAKQRLNPDGVFVQWLALNQFDIRSFEIILRSFRQVFPNAVLFVDAFRAALVGPASTLQGAPAMLANLRRMDAEQKHQATGTEGPWTWLGRFWGPLRMPEGKVQDEWAPQIEFRLPQARYSGQLDLAKLLDYLLKRRPSVEQAARMLHIETQDAKSSKPQYGQFEAAYAATGLAHRSWLAYLTRQGGKAEKILQAAYRANPRDRWIGFAVADGALANLDEAAKRRYDEQQVLESILKIRPDHTEVLTRLWQLESSRGNDEKARQYRARLTELNPLAKELRGR